MAIREYIIRVKGDTSPFEKTMDAADARMTKLSDNEIKVGLDIDSKDQVAVRNAIQAMINMDPRIAIQLTYDLDKRRLKEAEDQLTRMQSLAKTIGMPSGKERTNALLSYAKEEAEEIQQALENGVNPADVEARFKKILSFSKFTEDLGIDTPDFINDIYKKIASKSKPLYKMFDDFTLGKIKESFNIKDEISSASGEVETFKNELKVLGDLGASSLDGVKKGIGEYTRTYERLVAIAKTFSEIEIPPMLKDATDEDKASRLRELAQEFSLVGDEVRKLQDADDGSDIFEDKIAVMQKYQNELLKAFNKILGDDPVASNKFINKFIPDSNDWDIFNGKITDDLEDAVDGFQEKFGHALNDAQLFNRSTRQYEGPASFYNLLRSIVSGGDIENILDSELSEEMNRVSEGMDKYAAAMNKKKEAEKNASGPSDQKADSSDNAAGASEREAEADAKAADSSEKKSESDKKAADSSEQKADSAKEAADSSERQAQADEDAAKAAQDKANADKEAADAAKDKANQEKKNEEESSKQAEKTSGDSNENLNEEARKFEDVATHAHNAAEAKYEFVAANLAVAVTAQESADAINAEADALDRIKGSASEAANEKDKYGKSKKHGRYTTFTEDDERSESEILRDNLINTIERLQFQSRSDYGLQAQYGGRINDAIEYITQAGDDIEKLQEVEKMINSIMSDISTRAYDSSSQGGFNQEFNNLKTRFIDMADKIKSMPELEEQFGVRVNKILESFNKVKDWGGFDSLVKSVNKLESDVTDFENPPDLKKRLQGALKSVDTKIGKSDDLKSTFSEMRNRLANKMQNVALTEDAVSQYEAEATQLVSRMDDRLTRKQNLNKSISKLKGNISKDPALMGAFEDRINAIESRAQNVALLEKPLGRVEKVFDTLQNDIKGKKDFVHRRESLQNTLNDIGKQVNGDDDLKSLFSRAQHSLEERAKNVALNGNELDALEKSINTHLGKINKTVSVSKNRSDLQSDFESFQQSIENNPLLNGYLNKTLSLAMNRFRSSGKTEGSNIHYREVLNSIKEKSDLILDFEKISDKINNDYGLKNQYSGDVDNIRNLINESQYGINDILSIREELSRLSSEIKNRGYSAEKQSDFDTLKANLIKSFQEDLRKFPDLKRLYLEEVEAINEKLNKANSFNSLKNISTEISKLRTKIPLKPDNASVDDAELLLGNIETMQTSGIMNDGVYNRLEEIRVKLSDVISQANEAGKSFVDMSKIDLSRLYNELSDLDNVLSKTEAENIAKEFKTLTNNIPSYVTGNEGYDVGAHEKKYAELKTRVDELKASFGEMAPAVQMAQAAMQTYDSTMSKVINTDFGKSFSKALNSLENVKFNRDQSGGFTDKFSIEFDKLLSDIKYAKAELDQFVQSGDSIPVEKFERWTNLLNQVPQKLREAKDQANQLAKQGDIDKLLMKVNKDISANNLSGKVKEDYIALQTVLNNIKKTGTDISKIDMSKYNNQWKELHQTMIASGMDKPSFLNQFQSAIRNQSAQFLATYFSLQDFVRYGREIIQTVTQVDTAMTELRKVSGETDTRLAESFKQSSATAKELGATISEVINSTADWSRLGYNIDEAEELARVTQIYQNVGDNLTQETASEYLVSTLQGFQLNSDEALRVVDSINSVANNYAVDTQMIGESLERSAASFNASGTDLNKAIALVSATAEVTQDAASAGTVWKTMSARIRGKYVPIYNEDCSPHRVKISAA